MVSEIPVTVTQVASRADRSAFLDLPYDLHAHRSSWVPPLRFDVAQRLRPSSPYLDHAEAQLFLARRSGRVVGRIGATVNRLHNQEHRDTVGFFGFFECEEDSQTAATLFRAAEQWLAARGMTVMRGPMSFSVNDEIGLQRENGDSLPPIGMPSNPPYYEHLIASNRFNSTKDLLMWRVHAEDLSIDSRLQRLTAVA